MHISFKCGTIELSVLKKGDFVNRTKNIAYLIIVFIILMVALPLMFCVRIKEFDNQVKSKNQIIQELQDENAALQTQVKTLDEELKKLNNDFDSLQKDYDKLCTKVEEPEEEENIVTIEPETEEQLYAQKVTEQPTTRRATEQTTEATEARTEEPTEQPVTEEVTTEEEEIISDETDNGLKYSETYYVMDNHLTRSNGVVYYNGHKETWYSIHEPGQTVTARDIPGKHIADDGTIRDADGYVCVASSDLKFYTVVQTTVGPGKVYDCGCSHGTIDVYTNW